MKQKERKSVVNKINYKEKSCSPIKFKNKSYINKIELIKQNNEPSDSPFELPKASNKNNTKNNSNNKRKAQINGEFKLSDFNLDKDFPSLKKNNK